MQIYLDFHKGINPFYGLDQFLADETIIKRKSANRHDYYLVYKGKDEKGEYPLIKDVVWKHPEIVNEILPLINEKVKEVFGFGGTGLSSGESDDDLIDEE